jgi:hypothetical protein
VVNDSSEIRCPLCDTEGWPSSRMLAAGAAHCGSAWSDDGSYVNQSVACRVIAGLRFEVGLARMQLGVAS